MSTISDKALPLFLLAAGIAAASTSTLIQSNENAEPKDAAEARKMTREEQEDAKFAEVEEGFDQPLGRARPALIIVMGPASCGKSTIGMALSETLQIPFIDGDSLHPKSNVDKMSSGQPLDDNDRLPWLALIRSTAERVCRDEWVVKERGMFGVIGGDGNLQRETEDITSMADWEFGEGWRWRKAEQGGNGLSKSLGIEKKGLGRPAVIIACSALKLWYRQILRGEISAELPGEQVTGTDSDEPITNPDPSRMDTYFVYCKGSRELLTDRISKRKGHFFGSKMLDSQLATLEDPENETGVATVDISKTPEEITRQAVVKMVQLAKQ